MLKIYSTKRCHACQELKAELTKKGVKFENVFVEELDPQEQAKLQITSVPTIEDNGKFITVRELRKNYARNL